MMLWSVMKAKSLAICLCLLSFFSGVVLGYIFVLGRMDNVISALKELNLLPYFEMAEDAYFQERQDATRWAIENLTKKLEDELSKSGDNVIYTAYDIQVSLIICYGRLAKIAKNSIHQDEYELYVGKALAYAPENLKSDLQTGEDLLKYVEQYDVVALNKIRENDGGFRGQTQ